MAPKKPIDTLVLDTGAIIRNEPSVSTLLGKAESLFTVPAIISEIRDAATRSRVETLLVPFLTIRQPSPASMKFVTDFARRTGDLSVLSKPDLQIIALTYELECERNGGDWRLRRMPGQKDLNGPLPEGMKKKKKRSRDKKSKAVQVENAEKADTEDPAPESIESATGVPEELPTDVSPPEKMEDTNQPQNVEQTPPAEQGIEVTPIPIAQESERTHHESDMAPTQPSPAEKDEATQNELADTLAQTSLDENLNSSNATQQAMVDSAHNSTSSNEDSDSDSDSDDEGWITPGNLKQKQAEDAGASAEVFNNQDIMQVAVLTTDYAMQNVILQINLNLLSSGLMRVKNVRTTALRCHACFLVTKEMNKQFCPRCGKPTMTRVSCSTTADGGFQVHLKKNYQYNSRGDRYSIPKPVHGSTNGRLAGGGKGGWGNELILAEDQKEYERASKSEKRAKERNLMDEDYLPGILTGDRGRAGGRIKVGAGRNVNSKKR